MPVALNHTIVASHDREAAAEFLAETLGLQTDPEAEPFLPVRLDNDVTLDFLQSDGDITPQHYAFSVSDDDFDAIFARIRNRGTTYYSDPRHTRPGEINHDHGGRGLYFSDPSGHRMEILTRP